MLHQKILDPLMTIWLRSTRLAY